MRFYSVAIIAFVAWFAESSPAADAVALIPNAVLQFDFPDLPETFYSKSGSEKHPVKLTAQLPENYSPDRKFPIFVFLNGGSGGGGSPQLAREIAGPRDFIAVGMPLFKAGAIGNPVVLPGINVDLAKLITNNDGELLCSCYRTMLGKLFEAVPNITTQESAIGGFSNGGHAVAALITTKDSFIREHFTAYILYEGGMVLALEPASLRQPELKGARFLMLMGDASDQPARKLIAPLVSSLTASANASSIDFVRVIMRGYGHSMPAPYTKLAGNWLRHEKLPEIPPKEKYHQ